MGGGAITMSPSRIRFSRISQRFSNTSFRLANPPRNYYFLGEAWLAPTSPDSLVAEYYLLRWIALPLTVPSVLCIWAVARRLFGVHVAAGVTLSTALYPQFVLMPTAVNPDVLVYLCGTVVWCQGARLMTGDSVVERMVPMLCYGGSAFSPNGTGAPLILMSLVSGKAELGCYY